METHNVIKYNERIYLITYVLASLTMDIHNSIERHFQSNLRHYNLFQTQTSSYMNKFQYYS